MIKAVIFDIDGVLIDSFESNLQFFKSLFTMAGHKPPAAEDYRPIFHLSMHDVIKVLTKAPEEETKRIWELGKSNKVSGHEHLIVMTEGVKETVLALHKKYTLGIVTSRIKSSINIAGLSELQHCFNVAIAYEDTENHKPHPEPLFLACNRLNVKPTEAVYTGDTESDMKAGKAAGMKTIAFTKSNYKEADAHTFDFTEIPEIIEQLNS